MCKVPGTKTPINKLGGVFSSPFLSARSSIPAHSRHTAWELKVQVLRHKDLGSEPGPAEYQFQTLSEILQVLLKLWFLVS